MGILMKFGNLSILSVLAIGWSSHAHAAVVNVTVTFQNLAPTNSVSFAPLRVGFNNGTFDSFNIGTTATAPIVSIAEGGSGGAWFPAFAAADPTAVLGTVGGALVPVANAGGGFASSASQTFTIDTNVNRFFTFAAMVIPSNDRLLQILFMPVPLEGSSRGPLNPINRGWNWLLLPLAVERSART